MTGHYFRRFLSPKHSLLFSKRHVQGAGFLILSFFPLPTRRHVPLSSVPWSGSSSNSRASLWSSGGWCLVWLRLKAFRIAHSLKFFLSLRSCSSDSFFANNSVSGVQLVASCWCWAWVDCNNFASASWPVFLSDSRLEVPPVAHSGCCAWADWEELAAPATLLASFPISNFGSVLWRVVFISSDRSSSFTGWSTVAPVFLALSGNDSLSGTVPLLLTATGNAFPSTGCRCWPPGKPPRHLMAVLPASYPHHHKRNAHIVPKTKTPKKKTPNTTSHIHGHAHRSKAQLAISLSLIKLMRKPATENVQIEWIKQLRFVFNQLEILPTGNDWTVLRRNASDGEYFMHEFRSRANATYSTYMYLAALEMHLNFHWEFDAEIVRRIWNAI